MNAGLWKNVLEQHFGSPPSSVTTLWKGFEVLTEAQYTTGFCCGCRSTVAGDADPGAVGAALDGHFCDADWAVEVDRP